jgi:glutamate formiminotransferase/formiminotetrahydrofolate cyclodeaminase
LATKNAIEVPFRVMEKSLATMDIILAMAETGNPNSASDAGVGALCAKAAVSGAFLNVKINASSFDDKEYTAEIIKRGTTIERKAAELEEKILKTVESKL